MKKTRVKKGGVADQMNLGICYAHASARCIRSFLMDTAINLFTEEGKQEYANKKAGFKKYKFQYKIKDPAQDGSDIDAVSPDKDPTVVWIEKSSYEFLYDIILHIIIKRFGVNYGNSFESIEMFFKEFEKLPNQTSYLLDNFKEIRYVKPKQNDKYSDQIGDGTDPKPYHYIDYDQQGTIIMNESDTTKLESLITDIYDLISQKLKQNIHVLYYRNSTSSFDFGLFEKIFANKICQPIISVDAEKLDPSIPSDADTSTQSDDTKVNHAINIIGYNKPDSNTEPSYVIKNSWGIMWGDEGTKRIVQKYLEEIFNYTILFIFSDDRKDYFIDKINKSQYTIRPKYESDKKINTDLLTELNHEKAKADEEYNQINAEYNTVVNEYNSLEDEYKKLDDAHPNIEEIEEQIDLKQQEIDKIEEQIAPIEKAKQEIEDKISNTIKQLNNTINTHNQDIQNPEYQSVYYLYKPDTSTDGGKKRSGARKWKSRKNKRAAKRKSKRTKK